MKTLIVLFAFASLCCNAANAQLLGEWKNLKFYQYGKDTVDYPFDGQNPIIKVMVVNAGTTNSPSSVELKVTCPQVQGGELNKFPNGGKLTILKPGDTTIVSCWVIELYQKPSTPFQSGEYRAINATFNFETGSASAKESYGVKRDFVVYYAGQNPTTLGSTSIKGSIVFPSKPYPSARLAYNTLNWSGANLTLTSSDSGYTFSGAIGDRGDWYLSLSADGYKPSMTKISRSAAQTIRIAPQTSSDKPSQQFEAITSVKTSTGFWRGAASESEKTICVFPGQENWNTTQDSALKVGAKIYKYTFEGVKVWEYSPGWETWGGDMSRDGKYVAYALYTGTGAGASYKGGFTVGLLDGATGKTLWTKTGDKIYESYEVVFSNDGKYLGVGTTGSGQVSLLDRETGATVWSAPIAGELEAGQGFGQVRRMKFDAKNEYIYAGSGDNYLRKIRVSDGKIIWRTLVGAWPFVNGLNISADGNYVALGMKSAQVAVVRTSDGKVIWTYDTGNFDELFFSPDGKYAASYSGKHFDALTGELLGKSPSPAIGAFTSDSKYVCRYPSEVQLYSITGAGTEVYRTSTGTDIAQKAGEQAQWGYLANDDKYVVVAARDMASPPQTGLAFYRSKQTSTSVRSAEELRAEYGAALYPNPASGAVTIRFSASAGERASVAIRTLLGERVLTLFDGVCAGGEETVVGDVSGLATGVHLCETRVGGVTIPQMLTVGR